MKILRNFPQFFPSSYFLHFYITELGIASRMIIILRYIAKFEIGTEMFVESYKLNKNTKQIFISSLNQ